MNEQIANAELCAQILEEARRAYEKNLAIGRGNGEASPDLQTIRNVIVDMGSNGYCHTEATVKAVQRYMTFGERVGVWLSGPNGTGKSHFFEQIERSLNRLEIPHRKLFALRFYDLAFWKLDEIKVWLERVRNFDVLLDDVGIESISNDWGVKFEVLPIIVSDRMECESRTHITSNLDRKAIQERYKVGTFDRMRTLAERIPLVSASHRCDGVRCAISKLETWPAIPLESPCLTVERMVADF